MHNKLCTIYLLLLTLIGTTYTLLAQEQTRSEIDSTAKSYFYEAYNDSGQLSSQIKVGLYLKADSLFRRIDRWDFSILTILETCRLLQKQREYKRIDQLTDEAIDIANTKLDPKSDYYSAAFNLKGSILVESKKDFTNAIPLLMKAVEIEKGNSIALSYIYFNLGTCYQGLGDFDTAIEQYERILSIQLNVPDAHITLTPMVYNQLGFCYSNKNQVDLAIQHFELGLESAGRVQPRKRETDQVILYLYQNLAETYLKTGEYDLARKYINLALFFQKDQDFIKDNYSYQLQGALFAREDKQDAALISYKKSTAFAQREYKDVSRHPDIGMTYYQTANAWFAKNELDSALSYYQLALLHNSSDFTSEKFQINPSSEQLTNTLNAIEIYDGKAKTFLKRHSLTKDQNDLRLASNSSDLAIQAVFKTRNSINAEASKYTLAEKSISIYERAIETALLLYQSTDDDIWLKKAFQFAENNKAAALLESIKDNEALGSTGIPDSLLRREYNLQVEMAFYESLIHEDARKKSTAISKKKISDYKHTLFDYKEEYKRLIDGIEQAYPEYYALKHLSTDISIKDIQNKLTQTAAIIEFFVGQNDIYIFTITSENIFCEQIEKGTNFESDIQSFRKIINTAPTSKDVLKSIKQFKLLAQKHHDRFLKPVFNRLEEEINHLIIVPDDLLAYLPFSLLIDDNRETSTQSYRKLPYLFKKYGLSYNYSAALWMKHLNSKKDKADHRFIGFAPHFKNYKAEKQLSPLSCNTQEVSKLGESLGSESIKLDEHATLKYFNDHAGNYQIVHLATHTTLDPQHSAFNKIYFSDTYMNQNDLYNLNLNADLSVLSACNTGSGALNKGEGIMSLSRGFIHAGSRSLLMSMWSVDDCATSDIMMTYYDELQKGSPKEKALQEAKVRYLDETTDNLQAHPFYWAAFVQYGNTDPLSLSQGPNNILLIMVSLLIVVCLVWLIKNVNSRTRKQH